MDEYTTLGPISDFPPSRMRKREVNGKEVVVVNLDGSLHCFDNLCPHAAGFLSDGYLRGDKVVCIYHGAVFDVASGRSLEGVTPQPLRKYAIQVTDGSLQALIQE